VLDRLTSQTTALGTVSYQYDVLGRRTQMTVPNQSPVAYAYDAASRLTSITPGTSIVQFSYDAANRRTTLTLPNGITTQYGYDAASHLSALTYQLGATTLGDLLYLYDAAGNRIQVGGAWARTGIPRVVASATYNANNQQLTFGSQGLTYDLNGNLTSDGTNTYNWDARNRLAAIAGPVSATFIYDAAGRRSRKTINGVTTDFVYDILNPVQEQSAQTVTNLLTGLRLDEYFSRDDTISAAFFLSDALGSTVALADGSNSISTTYIYQPFGTTTTTGASTPNPYDFTARETDLTGLKYYRARYYHPTLQRFTSEDPLDFGGGDTSLYGYVLNNPLRFVDPWGLEYKDINLSFGFPVGIGPTGGVMTEGCQMYWYFGGGVMTPGLGASLTASPSSPTQGWNFGLQIALGVAGQVGYAPGPGGGWFWEAGIGGGFPTLFSASLTAYYVLPPITSPNCRPGVSKSAR